MKLYYYTGYKHLRNILKDRRVKVSRYGKFGTLNDPFELAPYDISDPQIRSLHKKAIDKIAETTGLICLSETRRSPAMWAHYTDNHEGACLEFEVTFDHVIKIKYQTKKLFQGLTLEGFDNQINEDNVEKLLGTKAQGWAYEKEHRLLVPLDNKVVISEDKHSFLPFQEIEDNTFMLRRVFVGYRCSKGISKLKSDVADYPHKVEVIQTRPAFKSFKVLEQRDENFWNWDESERGKEHSLPAVKAVFG